jgi:hypothetical protein
MLSWLQEKKRDWWWRVRVRKVEWALRGEQRKILEGKLILLCVCVCVWDICGFYFNNFFLKNKITRGTNIVKLILPHLTWLGKNTRINYIFTVLYFKLVRAFYFFKINYIESFIIYLFIYLKITFYIINLNNF